MATSKKAQHADVQVRVLCDCLYGSQGAVVELDPAALEQAVAAGVVDPDPAAVAYALTLLPETAA